MRIGVMLRCIEEQQGIGIYTQNLMDELLRQDTDREYVLFYRSPAAMGRYAGLPHVTEQCLRAPGGKAGWDQLAVPRAARRARVDLLFHPKFTLPFLATCKTVMTVHGASWFVHPELYGKLDIAYINRVMPRYCRKADAIIANSELTRQDFIRLVGVNPDTIHTIRLGTNRDFRPIDDNARLADARQRYNLPERFILSVIKYDPRKNFKNLIAAFRLLRQRMPEARLVVTGIGCEKYIAEYDLRGDGTADAVRFLGWVDQAELPLLYNLADCLFFPSVYEEFGIPTCEAMACGCPVVVSRTGAPPEIAGNAGILVDQFNPPAMADALERLLGDDTLRADLAQRSLDRAREFTWERCAEQTRKLFDTL